ncbi:MAG: hypothetical protein ACRDDX_12105 [Cellulosilyticaceae bacterium]
MATAGDWYRIELKAPHLEWGELRYTRSRDIIYGEGYIPIPADVARDFELYNSNSSCTGLGYNIFNCTSEDGFLEGQLKSGGSSRRRNVYAKQFHGYGNLKALGDWFAHCGAREGDCVEVEWISATDIVIRLV